MKHRFAVSAGHTRHRRDFYLGFAATQDTLRHILRTSHSTAQLATGMHPRQSCFQILRAQ